MPESNKINGDIQTLRAIAVLMVLFNHLYNFIILPNTTLGIKLAHFHNTFVGWGGVDLFLVISGFVISRNLLPELIHCSIKKNLTDDCLPIIYFWIKRFYRLFPSALTWLLLTIIFSIFFNSSDSFGTLKSNFNELVMLLTCSRNIGLSYEIEGQPIISYWSLSLEDQFYIVFPILLLFIPNRKLLLAILLPAIFSQFFLDRKMFELPWVLRTDAIMWGIVLYLFSETKLYKQISPTHLKNSFLNNIVLFTCLLLLMTIPQVLKIMPINVGLIAIVSTILVWIATYDMDIILFTIKPIMHYIGDRSYAIYITHNFSYYLSKEIWFRIAEHHALNSKHTLNMLITAMIFTFIFAELNYKLIETPLRKKGKHIIQFLKDMNFTEKKK